MTHKQYALPPPALTAGGEKQLWEGCLLSSTQQNICLQSSASVVATAAAALTSAE